MRLTTYFATELTLESTLAAETETARVDAEDAPTVALVLGTPLIFGAMLPPYTVIENGAADTLVLPSETLMMMFDQVPVTFGCATTRPVA